MGDFGSRREDKVNKLIKDVHHNNVLRKESAAMLSERKRASPAEEDAPGKRARCDDGVLLRFPPDIIEEFEIHQPQVSRI